MVDGDSGGVERFIGLRGQEDAIFVLALDQTNTACFLFGEDEGVPAPDVNNHLDINGAENKFLILVRRDEFSAVVCYGLFNYPRWFC